MAGMLTGPPLALGQPKPMSSIKTITTLGAPFGGRRGLIGGNSAWRASRAILPLDGMSGIGRISRPVFSGSCDIDLSPFNRIGFNELPLIEINMVQIWDFQISVIITENFTENNPNINPPLSGGLYN
jgi:hypothetical protein